MRNAILLGVACVLASGYLATRSQLNPPVASASQGAQALFVPQAGRLLYRYSVVPGGVRNKAEVALQRKIDNVVAAHYLDVQDDRLVASTLPRPRRLYVSYRRNNRVYWTRKPVILPAGERVLSEGANLIRVRCGNRLSATPMLPVAAVEPPAGALDELLPREPASNPAAILPIHTALYFPLLATQGGGTRSPLLLLADGPAVTTPGTSGTPGPSGTPGQPTLPGGPGPEGTPSRPTEVSPQVPFAPETPAPFLPGGTVTPPTGTIEPEMPDTGSTPLAPPMQTVMPTEPTIPTVPSTPAFPTPPGTYPSTPVVPTTPVQTEVPTTPGLLTPVTPETPINPVTPGGESGTVPGQPILPGLPEVLSPSEQPTGPIVPELLPETPDLPVTPVPEPGTYVLVGLGLAAMALWRRR